MALRTVGVHLRAILVQHGGRKIRPEHVLATHIERIAKGSIDVRQASLGIALQDDIAVQIEEIAGSRFCAPTLKVLAAACVVPALDIFAGAQARPQAGVQDEAEQQSKSCKAQVRRSELLRQQQGAKKEHQTAGGEQCTQSRRQQ